jgi:hypothetical protein
LVLLFLVSCVNGDEILVEPTPEATTAPVTPTDTRITPTGTPPTMPATTSGAAPISTQEIESPVTSLGHLLYTDLNGIAKIDLDTGEVTRLSEPVETDRVNGIRREWLAYWQTMGDVSTLNLLNVEDESLKVAMTLTDSNDWTPHLFWSADGLYLFVTLEPPPTPAVLGEPTRDYVGVRRYYLYSQETGEIELWNRDCDRIGFSPRTKRIAMWCPSVGEAETTYAVVEWGGEIWFTPEPPDTILKVRALEYSLPTWAWSDDGRQVVYPSQDRAISTTLVLATTHSGELTTEILGDGYSLSYVGLHWSADQRFIAFKGQCPTIAPCLLVLDLKTAEVVWTSESLGEINRNLADHFWHPSANLLLQPSFPGVYRIFVIDPLSQEIIRQIELGDARFGIGWLP